jgi:hypothetical protein
MCGCVHVGVLVFASERETEYVCVMCECVREREEATSEVAFHQLCAGCSVDVVLVG